MWKNFLVGLVLGVSFALFLASMTLQDRNNNNNNNSNSNSNNHMNNQQLRRQRAPATVGLRLVNNNTTKLMKKLFQDCSQELLLDKKTKKKPKEESAAICAIQKGALPYLEEWVDYHLSIGFSTIYIMDNSDTFETKEWAESRNPDQVVTTHVPGEAMQLQAYKQCASMIVQKEQQQYNLHDWIAFIDIDEFIVLNKHSTILELLHDVVGEQAGGLALNHVQFEFHNQTTYQPFPVTKRFQSRLSKPSDFVKVIARTKFIQEPNVHFMKYKNRNTRTVDTRGFKVGYHYGLVKNGVTDVASIYHYKTKSLEEYRSRCQRGDVYFSALTKDQEGMEKQKQFCSKELTQEYFDESSNTHNANLTFDDTAWQMLKRNVPLYARYDL
jgi:hypothetical protein